MGKSIIDHLIKRLLTLRLFKGLRFDEKKAQAIREQATLKQEVRIRESWYPVRTILTIFIDQFRRLCRRVYFHR